MLEFKTKSVWFQNPTVFAVIQDHTAGKWLNLDQLPSGMLQNTFVQGTKSWARWTLGISPSEEVLRAHVWYKQSKEDLSSLWLLDDFFSFGSGNKTQARELSDHSLYDLNFYFFSSSTPLSYFSNATLEIFPIMWYCLLLCHINMTAP